MDQRCKKKRHNSVHNFSLTAHCVIPPQIRPQPTVWLHAEETHQENQNSDYVNHACANFTKPILRLFSNL